MNFLVEIDAEGIFSILMRSSTKRQRLTKMGPQGKSNPFQKRLCPDPSDVTSDDIIGSFKYSLLISVRVKPKNMQWKLADVEKLIGWVHWSKSLSLCQV